MKYIINIVTTTKNKDLYEQVAVNEYPIIITCKDENRLKEILSGFQDHIRNELKTKNLYNKGYYYIRTLDDHKIIWSVPDVTKVSY